MSILNIVDRTLNITVSGGNGTVDFDALGIASYYYITAPSAAASYNWQILNTATSKIRVGGSNSDPVTGDQYGTFYPLVELARGTYTFRIFGATDGAYTVTLTIKDKN